MKCKVLLFVTLFAFSFVDYATACGRCGLFGRRCRYYKSVPSTKEYSYGGTKDIVISNTFLNPYAVQGTTAYITGHAYPGAAALLTPFDKTEVLAQAAGLALAVNESLKTSLSVYDDAAQEAIRLDAESVQTISKAKAVSDLAKVLLDEPEIQVHNQTLVIRRDASGRYHSEVVTDETPSDPNKNGEVDPNASPSIKIMMQSCGKCHSGNDPKAGLVLDGSQAIPDKRFRRIQEVMLGINVPEPMKAVITALGEEKRISITKATLQLAP